MSVGVARALPALAALLCCAWLAIDDGGFYVPTWSAATVAAAALVLVLVLGGWRLRASLGRPAAVALAALVAVTLWSFAGALWAQAPGDAVRGSLITCLYLALFALPVLWPPRPVAAERLLTAAALGIAALGAVGVARVVDGSLALTYARLAWPTGYPNATAAVFACGMWIALVVAARGSAGRVVGAVCFGAAVWLGGLLVLAQSLGAILTLPFAAALFVALSPQRLRALCLLVLGALLVAPAVPLLARVVDAYPEAQASALARAAAVLGLCAVAAVLVHLAVARLLERPGFRSPGRAARAGILVACLLLVLGAGATVSPSARVAAAWSDLSRTTSGQGSPGVISLGTNRADFWRVGLDEFARHPVGGIGVDNFQAAYLQHRRSDEQPRASHSFVVRALSETGLVGTALLASFVLGVALVLARRARREAPTGVVAQAAAVALTGWLLHGTVEWLWEMPATGALAFAIAGIGVGTAGGETVSLRPRPVVRAGVAVAVACVGLLAGALWLSVRYEERGAGRWRSEPVAAAADLRRAARLDPLGADALLLRGAIAARRGRWQETRLAFAESLSRDPSNWYAWLELGLAEARLGHDHVALAAARRAGVLNPRESVPSLLIRAIRRADLPSQAELERELAASPT